jgi:hypothetical protein
MGWPIGVRFPARNENFSSLYRIQTSSGFYPASYQMVAEGSFSGGKAAGV